MTEARCSWCLHVRPIWDLVPYWPHGQPENVRYVCRPGPGAGKCFQGVPPRATHTVGPVSSAPAARRQVP